MGGKILASIADIVIGQSPPSDTCNNKGDGLPLLNGPTEFGQYSPLPVQFTTDARKRAREGDILFCVRGSTTGRMNWADREYAIGRGVAAIRHRSGIEYRHFLRGLLDYKLPRLLVQATGSTFPNVSFTQLSNLLIEAIEDGEMLSIGHILGALENKMELLRKQNDTLEQMVSVSFAEMFSASDPASNRACVRTYAEHIKTSVNPSKRGDEMYAHYSIPAFDNGKKAAVEKGSRILSNKYIVESNTILFSKLNPDTPRVWVVFDAPQNAVCSTEFQVLKPRDEKCFVFLYALLRYSGLARELAGKVQGTSSSHQRIKPEDLFALEFPEPSDNLLAKYHPVAYPLLTKVDRNEEQIQTLRAIRDLLLPKLMSGAIKVSN
jgi:type I restriction enzyme, S subunit